MKIGKVKKAYMDANGNVVIKSMAFRLKLFDPTAILPHYKADQWCLYTPFNCEALLKPGEKKLFNMGMSITCPKGFVLYFYTSCVYTDYVRVEDKIITCNDKREIELLIINIGDTDFGIRKYMNIAMFTLLPILNDD